MGTTVAEIRDLLQNADRKQLETLEHTLAADTRKGVQQALDVARRRIQALDAERDRLDRLYKYQDELIAAHGGRVAVGLDEVGRGPIAGPLTVGAVVLPSAPYIEGLNDSKQISPEKRFYIAEQIRETALAYAIEFIEPEEIDNRGMTSCLVAAFEKAVTSIENQGIKIDVVLLDGNPLHMDEREVNIVKGDAKCASIAAASILAKVARDQLMVDLGTQYPGYHFEDNKGYGSAAHIEAIKQFGLSPVHRRSFCKAFTQQTLF